jgi:hypothetical protein
MPDDPSFIGELSASAGGQWISLAANLLQIGEYLWGAIVGGPDTDQVLQLLDQISGEIASTYLQLRDLVLRESARIINEIDVVAYQQELARSSTAYANLKEYRRANGQGQLEQDVLAAALSLSKEPCDFFVLQNDVQALASFIFCVQVRIDVLRTAIAPPYYTQRLYIQEIEGYIDFLNSLIANVIQGVNDSHVIVQMSQGFGKPPRVFFRLFWVHQQITRIYSPTDPNAPGTTRTVNIKSIEYPGTETPASPRPLPTEEEAQAEIEADRERGVAQELAYLGIPTFIQIRDAWRRLLEQASAFEPSGRGKSA